MIMNASVIVGIVDRASQGLDRIGDKFGNLDKRAKETQERLDKLGRMQFVGAGMATAGAAGMAALGAATNATLNSASQLEDVMKNFEINAFGKALMPDAGADAIQAIIDQAQDVADSQDIELTFRTKGDAMAFLKAEADELAKSLGELTIYGRTDAIAAFDALQKNGVQLKDIFNGAGAATLYLAQISKQAPTDAADAISKMASSYQLTGEQVEELANTIVKVDGASAASAQSISAGFKYAAGSAKTLGMDVDDLAVTLGSLNSRGLDESTAGTGLDMFLNRLAKQSKEGEEALEKLGLSTESFKGTDGNILPMVQVIDKLKASLDGFDAFQQQEILNTIFGDQGMRVATALMKDGAGSMEEIRKQMDSALGLTERAALVNDSYSASVQRMGESWDKLKTSIGGAGIKEAADAVDFIANKISELGDYMEGAPDLSKRLFIGGAAVSGLLIAGGLATVLVASIQKAKLVWGQALRGKSPLEQQAERTKVDFDKLAGAAERAKRQIQGVNRETSKINRKTLTIDVNRTRVDQFAAWLKAQQWRKTVFVDYVETGGVGGGGRGRRSRGGTTAAGSRGRRGTVIDVEGTPVRDRPRPLPSTVVRSLPPPKPALPAPKPVLPPPKPALPAPKPVLPGPKLALPPPSGAMGFVRGAPSMRVPGAANLALTGASLAGSAMAGTLESELHNNGAEIALSTAGSIAGGLLAGALGSVIPGAGTIIGGMIGSSLGGMAGSTLGRWIDDNRNEKKYEETKPVAGAYAPPTPVKVDMPFNGNIIVNEATNAEETSLMIRRQLNDFANNEMPSAIQKMSQRAALVKVQYRPGLAE